MREGERGRRRERSERGDLRGQRMEEGEGGRGRKREREEEGGRGDSKFLRQLCTCDDQEPAMCGLNLLPLVWSVDILPQAYPTPGVEGQTASTVMAWWSFNRTILYKRYRGNLIII